MACVGHETKTPSEWTRLCNKTCLVQADYNARLKTF
jgi:hypothetical protein